MCTVIFIIYGKSVYSISSTAFMLVFFPGATGDHVFVHMYPGHSEDFAGSDLSQLDTWVFGQVAVQVFFMVV